MFNVGLEALWVSKPYEPANGVNHNDITIDNYHESRPALDLYLSHDVRGLLEVVLLFNQKVYYDLKIDASQCLTGASLSKQNFFRNY